MWPELDDVERRYNNITSVWSYCITTLFILGYMVCELREKCEKTIRIENIEVDQYFVSCTGKRNKK